MAVKDIAGIAIAVLVVAGLMVAVRPGAQTGNVLANAGAGFASVIRAATGQAG